MSSKPLLPVKSDFVFKMIFGDQRNAEILAAFLKSVLDIPEYEYERLVIIDPHIKKEFEHDKYGILDVKVHTKSMSVVHVEIQLQVFPDLKQRILYSQSKLVTEQISSGQDWSVIKRVITIIITDELFIHNSDDYINQFRYRTANNIEFSRLSEINSLELGKLPMETDNTALWYWTKLIKSDDEEALDMLSQRDPHIKKAVAVLKELSADERARMLYEEHETRRRDIASMVNGARKEGRAEGHAEGHAEGRVEGHAEGRVEGRAEGRAEGRTEVLGDVLHNAMSLNMDIDSIMRLTGLSREDVEAMKK